MTQLLLDLAVGAAAKTPLIRAAATNGAVTVGVQLQLKSLAKDCHDGMDVGESAMTAAAIASATLKLATVLPYWQ